MLFKPYSAPAATSWSLSAPTKDMLIKDIKSQSAVAVNVQFAEGSPNNAA
jgi:hypothetical protein